MPKICVYAICKNESKFVKTFCDSAKEADYVVVLDTGSTDDTVRLLEQQNITRIDQKEITPWRFDVARNESMKLIPDDTDICVCLDLDEVIQPGWADKLRASYNKLIDRYRYKYIWNWVDDKEGVVYMADKIHKYGSFEWVHAVHEVLHKKDDTTERQFYIKDFVVEHHADKTKSRSSYLNLLKLDVEERPNDDRARHYYARELMFHGINKEAIEQFKIHLSMPNSTWDAERCASMRYIAKCSEDNNDKIKWLYKAIAEAPYLREPYIDISKLLYSFEDWYGVIFFCEKALLIKDNQYFYMNDPIAWGSLPYDLLSIAYWSIGDKNKAKENVKLALEKSPNDERIKKNFDIINA